MFDTRVIPLDSLRNLHVTVMGLGLFGGGEGVTRFFCAHGAQVTVTDKRTPDVLAPSIERLAGLPVRWVLGEHREQDFTCADLVVPSPAIPRDTPLLELARDSGVALDTEMNLFWKYCPAKICAITGTNGKTTTTSLIGHLARAAWPATPVGGNLGRSLLPEVSCIHEDGWVVLELSSFQLEDLFALTRRPQVSVITNVTPNHLDRHHSYENYLAAKRTILEPSSDPNTAVLNAEDARVRSWYSHQRRTLYFGRSGLVRPRASGVWVDIERGNVLLQHASEEHVLFSFDDLSLPGTFNLLNAAAAAAAVIAMGVPIDGIAPAIRAFRTVEHRLEPFHEMGGVRFFNDSIATTPESTIAALDALGPRVVLICGGARGGDRSYTALGQRIARQTHSVVLVGQTANDIAASIPTRGTRPRVHRAATLEDAVRHALDTAVPGDRVVLSPACASYDMFVNYMERGSRFKELIRDGAPHNNS